ncbi:MAG: UDP-N-acetylmuramate dehydrogenase [Negativicutes bacterium]|nr:UDP-N-acetylmuramate dehydrogenase [Negativicutes bacterium]
MSGADRLAAAAAAICGAGNVLPGARLADYTTFKIGGPADLLCRPTSIVQLARLRRLAHDNELPFMVIGNGSNLLVSDRGIAGVVVHCGDNLATVAVRPDGRVVATAGVLLKDVAAYCADRGLAGLEFAVGIPGTIGGSVYMNAGAYGGEMASVVDEATVVGTDGSIAVRCDRELRWWYRGSSFQSDDLVVASVVLRLTDDSARAIYRRMADYTSRRQSRQPLDMPSAGSVFKRPPGYYAGTLIEQCGLKGRRCGGAMVSVKHAGFIVNAGGATAGDVLRLIDIIQTVVRRQTGVELVPEVRFVGRK